MTLTLSSSPDSDPCQCVPAWSLPCQEYSGGLVDALLHTGPVTTSAQHLFSIPELVNRIVLSLGFAKACIMGAPKHLLDQLFDESTSCISVLCDSTLSWDETRIVLKNLRERGVRPTWVDTELHEFSDLICEVFAICDKQRFDYRIKYHVFRMAAAMGQMAEIAKQHQ